MALIEHIGRPNWQEMLDVALWGALDVLKRDRFVLTGSSIDDMRSWLTSGGVVRVRQQLQRQMTAVWLTPERQQEILAYLDVLIQRYQRPLLDLMAQAIIPSSADDVLSVCGLTDQDVDQMLQAVQRGEQPVVALLRAHGLTEEAIQQLYHIIDTWLAQQGIRPMPGSDPQAN